MDKFAKSKERFRKHPIQSKIVGYMNWEMEHPNGNFLLQCWNHEDRGAIIIQIWADGNGFNDYYPINETNIDAMRQDMAAIKARYMTNSGTFREDGSWKPDSIGDHETMGMINKVIETLKNI